ncbi:hypothetical protein MKY37_20025 [Psychrobacillus sp. FSL K6-2836]|uniref:hypothetical protein n=1 Tax=Psychrobacillus sp. FSL K6-2836 TaxID=2921548 RepID=UPI0030F7FE96
MPVNNGGNLSKEYFKSYLNLIMVANMCTMEEAKEYMFEQFFKGNKDTFGEYSYYQFLQVTEG